MLNKKISLILLLLSFFVIIGSVSASEDTNHVVGIVTDNGTIPFNDTESHYVCGGCGNITPIELGSENVASMDNNTIDNSNSVHNECNDSPVYSEPDELPDEDVSVTNMNNNTNYTKKIVNPTIITNDLFMTPGDGSKFQVTILDSQGNPIPHNNVAFNINGIFYTNTTDENGIASLDMDYVINEWMNCKMVIPKGATYIMSTFFGYEEVHNTVRID